MLGKKILVPLGGGLPKNFKYVTALNMDIDDEYILTAELIDQNGDIIGEQQRVDLPLEAMVVDGSYDSSNESLILILQNGNTIDIPVSGLISGLQETLVSGENIKTIGGQSVLGSGDIPLPVIEDYSV